MEMQEFKQKLRQAKSLAAHAHKARTKTGQEQLYGDAPYTVHLENVESILLRFGYYPAHSKENRILALAAWLHDVLEDTTVSEEELERLFGPEVVSLVKSVTKEDGKNRKEKDEKTFPKTKAHPLGVTLKLADRIANMESSYKNAKAGDSGLLKMYLKEHTRFKCSLYTRGVADSLWLYLDNLVDSAIGDGF